MFQLRVNSLPQAGSDVLTRFGTMNKSSLEQEQAVGSVPKALWGQVDFPCLYKYEEGGSPCQESSVREAAVSPCQWKVFVHALVWERRVQTCLFTANP